MDPFKKEVDEKILKDKNSERERHTECKKTLTFIKNDMVNPDSPLNKLIKSNIEKSSHFKILPSDLPPIYSKYLTLLAQCQQYSDIEGGLGKISGSIHITNNFKIGYWGEIVDIEGLIFYR